MKCIKDECCDVCIYHTLVSKEAIETGKLKVLCTNVMSKNCGKEFERNHVCSDYKGQGEF